MKAIQQITSRDNQKLKFARNVREGKVSDKIFIEGLRLAEEVLRSDLTIFEVFISEDFGEKKRENEVVDKIMAKNVNASHLPEKTFRSIADTDQSQGIILIAEKPKSSKAAIVVNLKNKLNKLSLVVFLHEINNPSNLGAILRTAEAVGIAGVIISAKSADVFSAKSVRAAMGANLRLPIWENAEFDEVLAWAQAQNLTTTAADINAEKSYTKTDWNTPRLLIFGSEAHGLSEDSRVKIDELTFIPMENDVESLNLAVSCGIILFEARRQKSLV